MRISYFGDFRDRSFEGLMKIVFSMKEHFEKKGYEIVLNEKKADLIHVHSSGLGPSFSAARLKKKLKIPCVYSLYSTCEESFLNHIKNYIQQRLYFDKRTLKYFIYRASAVTPLKWRAHKLKEMDTVVVASEYTKNKLYKNTRVIKIGIDGEKFKPTKIKKDKLNIGYFGHTTALKGIPDLIRASRNINLPVSFYVSNKTKRFERYVNKRNPNIKIYGYVNNIVSEYNKQDIVILPYRSTLAAIANPLVLLEVMACGRAIITTNLSNIKEIVKDSALLVNPYSPDEIVKAVDKLKDEKLREKLGKKAREIILEDYNQEKMFNEYEKLYNEIVR